MKIGSMMLVLALALTSLQAEAGRRFGGGKSIGHQSNNVTQREAVKAPPAAPANTATAPQKAAPAAAPAPAATPPVAQPQRRPWGAMLGGLAAGLGLAWLANSLGLGGLMGAMGQFMMFALLASERGG